MNIYTNYSRILQAIYYSNFHERTDLGVPQFPEIIGTPDTPITLGNVGVTLDVSPLTDGLYNLRAVATDSTNQTDANPPAITFDLQLPPAPPANLTVSYNAPSVTLSWDANTETDLAGYYVYRDNVSVATVATPDTAFSETLTDGAYSYAVSSYDINGNESAKSAPKSITVDNTAPVITLTAPADNDKVSGIVNIAGTVTETNPGTTLIELGAGILPVTYDLLKTIEGAVISDTLHSFNTASYTAGDYTIRVGSTDLSGNAAAPETVVISIDNEPPPAPSGLTAVATTDGKVDLSWSAVTDASPPVSYSVYYKDSSAAAFIRSGTSSGTAYTVVEQLVLNTLYYFAITAIDSLGNESGYSNIAEVIPRYDDAPVVPVIFYPASAGSVYNTGRQTEDIAVWANPYTDVSLVKDSVALDTVRAPYASVRSLIYDNPTGYSLAISPDGKYTAIIKSGYLYLVNNSTGYEALALNTYLGSVYHLSWSPDSKKLAYVVNNTIKVYDLKTQIQTDISADTMIKPDIEWSGDASKIAAICVSAGRDIFIYDLSGSAPVQYTFDGINKYDLSYSPDSTRIVYEAGYQIYLLDIPSAVVTLVSTVGGDASDNETPNFSPDGERVTFIGSVFTSGVTKNYVHVKNIVTGALASLETPTYPGYNPRWSPSGREIIYYSYQFSDKAIFVVGYDLSAESFTTTEKIAGYTQNRFYDQCGWFDDGRIWAYSVEASLPYAFYAIEPTSRFVFNGVPLNEGANVFTAYASNSAGDLSALSEPVTINYDPALQDDELNVVSDLYVMNDRLFIVPNAPVVSNEVVIQASVMNESAETRENVIVNLKVRDINDALAQIGSDIIINTLAPDEVKVVAFTWTPQSHGDHDIIITVDPYDSVSESNEANNALTRSVNVNMSLISAGIFLVNNTFSANEDVGIDLLFANQGGSPADISYTLTVEDLSGSVYETITANAATLAEYSSQEGHVAQYN